MMNADQVARMDQAGAYLQELAGILLGCYTKLVNDGQGMPPHLAAQAAEALVVAAMEINSYRDPDV